MNRKDRRAEAARHRHAKTTVGIELRYGGRTLVVTAYVNTDEEPEAVYERIQVAARGPKMAMAITTVAAASTDDTKGLWETQDIPTFFDGKTLIVTSFINTDESLDHDLTKRVMNAANKPSNQKTSEICGGQLAVIVTGGEAPTEEATEMWRHFILRLKEQKDGPN